MSAAVSGTNKAVHSDGAPKKKKGPGALATAYLVIYNVVMTAGWLVIAVGLVRAYLARGSYHGLYYSIEKPLKFFQTGAILEIVHCAIGIVPSSVVLTGFQVMSRVFLTWAVTHSVREVQSEDSVLLFVAAWTVTEIIRYSFYTFSLLNHLPYLIKWASVPSALLPHDPAEEEGSGPRWRLQQSGVIWSPSPMRPQSRASKGSGLQLCPL
ncbi:very-long-chain (3R)-3-hydroxyacyl-CoA dehydratase 2 isoform X2 [Dunckerocampus dactyliophorus]|uniref:very-long-chain (3R)-3-hydroxyacyl-CoA dehydratase 2 isoform X2 n=1 Tax=Dunckerocampus dactyliophorus TaxID=161453 RepID=UPI002405AD44|nr:very-long-chain (3R)-3-hydroxyacyl-CoA dehydratase 2 isoform X2 [Dunckerocampus dactyliophorus]